MRCYLIGGFLGSGKTTAIQEACNQLLKKGSRIGVITNDQGTLLVDSEILNVQGLSQEQIVNGCFCCRYTEFKELLDTMKANVHPDYLFAEAVGSCADLVATIVKPLLRQGFEADIVYTVFADAELLLAVLQGNAAFLNEDVRYIYRKQLEEADLILISKTDLLTVTGATELQQVIEAEYPGKIIRLHNSFNPDNVSNWLSCLEAFTLKDSRKSLDIDYEIYARGELSLAWTDEMLFLSSLDGTAKTAAYALTQLVHKNVLAAGYPVGHLKFLLDDGMSKEKISYTTIARTVPTMPYIQDEVNEVTVLVNARLQTGPGEINAIMRKSLEELKQHFTGDLRILQSHSFTPGKPVPVWRVGD